MEMVVFLKQEKELMENMLKCLEREKQALIKENARDLLDIIEEKKSLMNTLHALEEKRSQMYPGMTLRKMEEAGLLREDGKKLGVEMKDLAERLQQLQETNSMLTQQSLEYTHKMLSIIGENSNKVAPSYGANGKIEKQSGKKNSLLDHSV